MNKRKKHEVNYSRATNSNATCNGCAHYLGGACEVVEGQISGSYWCRLHQQESSLEEEPRGY